MYHLCKDEYSNLLENAVTSKYKKTDKYAIIKQNLNYNGQNVIMYDIVKRSTQTFNRMLLLRKPIYTQQQI